LHAEFVYIEESHYVISTISANSRSGEYEYTAVRMGARPEPPNVLGDVYGCGLLMDSDNKLTIFFTINGILLGQFFLMLFMYTFNSKKTTKK
jgi:hypothetical protein